MGSRLDFALERARDPNASADEQLSKEQKETSDGRKSLPEESVIVRNLRLHLDVVHDLLPDIERRDDPGDHEPQPRLDEVDAGAPPPTRTEHIVSRVQTLLGFGIDGFEETFGFE